MTVGLLTGAVRRRELLQAGLAATALGALGGVALEPAAAARRWPSARLGPADARRVNPRQFIRAAQLREWQEALDDIGLRAPGTAVHDRYVDGLADRLERAGVRGVVSEGVPLRRWQPGRFGLDVVGGTSAGPVKVASYIPYSGQTPGDGITAALAAPGTPPVGGRIALFDVAPTPLTHGAFDLADYGRPQHPPGYNPAAPYDRAWVSALQIPRVLETLRSAGASGAVGVLPLPAEAADGSYFPYDGVLREIPALYVDRDTGAELKQIALAGGTVRLTLEAQVDDVTTPNLYGFIPGRSDELVILHCHHDGTNGIEDNGQEAIVAMSQYLARLPRRLLPRSILVLFSTGHMAGRALGSEAFIEHHRDDLVKRTAAALTLEHLGALEWLPGPDGRFALTGKAEDGGIFASPFDAVIDPARIALRTADVTPDRVMRPWLPDQRSPNWVVWPGDGQPFWAMAGLPAGNFIVGPTYLLNAGMSTVDKTDFRAMRRQAMAFTQLVLRLAATPLEELRSHRDECSLCREPGS